MSLDNLSHVRDFLESQKVLHLSTHGDAGIWASIVYFILDSDSFNFYFVSSRDTRHSKDILANPQVAFSTAWFDGSDHANRKGVQGRGTCHLVIDRSDIEKGVALHNKIYPEFSERLTVDYIVSDENQSSVWIISPETLKFWSDEHYGGSESEIFTF